MAIPLLLHLNCVLHRLVYKLVTIFNVNFTKVT